MGKRIERRLGWRRIWRRWWRFRRIRRREQRWWRSGRQLVSSLKHKGTGAIDGRKIRRASQEIAGSGRGESRVSDPVWLCRTWGLSRNVLRSERAVHDGLAGSGGIGARCAGGQMVVHKERGAGAAVFLAR